MLLVKRPHRRGAAVSTAVSAAALLLLLAGPASAATDVYPPGGGAFGASAEGWQATEADCNIPLGGGCSASGAHDPAAGNPAGSLAAKTSVLLNLGGLLQSTVVFESPDFVVAEDGVAALHAEGQLSPAGLLSLQPQTTYTISLIDRDTETPTELLEETLEEGDTSFGGNDAAAAVAAGGTYAIAIEAVTSSSQTGLAVVGDATARFDNVALTVQTVEEEGGGGPGGEGPPGPPGDPGPSGEPGSSLTSSSLLTLVRRSSSSSASMRGRHVFVRASCPRRAGGKCWMTLQGRLGKGVPVTQRRAVRIAKGKSRVVGLQVRPRFREQVAKRKRLLIVQKVRVGEVTATFARSRVLIRR